MTTALARPRWYRVTPDRCVALLLALEGLLILSERFQWFPFNQHKGYTMLIAAAGVGLAMLLMFLWFLAALIFRRRFQFSILSLLLLVVVVAIPCSWLATETKQARKQQEAVKGIRKAGGTLSYDYEFDPSDNGNWIGHATPPGPAWLRNSLGDDLLASVTRIEFPPNSEVTDAMLEDIGGLAQLRALSLGYTTVDDIGLKHLKGLVQLQSLFLNGTAVSDAGLEHLKGLVQLPSLFLHGTEVTDAGLEHLKGLNRLEVLDLINTAVSDAGAKKLRQALPNCVILSGQTAQGGNMGDPGTKEAP